MKSKTGNAMSVLKNRRKPSKAQFINTASAIYMETLYFITRLSARFSRHMSKHAMSLAAEVADFCEKANSVYPSDEVRVALREEYLLRARAALLALDTHLARIYDILMTNPQGCFTTSSGKTISSANAMDKLDKMSQSLGDKIDNENAMLTALLKSDKRRPLVQDTTFSEVHL